MAQTKRALAYFMTGKKEKAIADLDIILQNDDHERSMLERGLQNS